MKNIFKFTSEEAGFMNRPEADRRPTKVGFSLEGNVFSFSVLSGVNPTLPEFLAMARVFLRSALNKGEKFTLVNEYYVKHRAGYSGCVDLTLFSKRGEFGRYSSKFHISMYNKVGDISGMYITDLLLFLKELNHIPSSGCTFEVLTPIEMEWSGSEVSLDDILTGTEKGEEPAFIADPNLPSLDEEEL